MKKPRKNVVVATAAIPVTFTLYPPGRFPYSPPRSRRWWATVREEGGTHRVNGYGDTPEEALDSLKFNIDDMRRSPYLVVLLDGVRGALLAHAEGHEDLWDRTLAESAAALEMLADEALAEHRAGLTEEMK